MSYRGSSLKFRRHLTWNHVWDCLVITDLRPIFSHLCTPLLSSPLFRSLELTPCGEGWWIPGFPKHICWASLFEARSPLTHTHAVQTHTHTCNHYATDASQDKWTKVLRPTVLPTSRLKKSCITTSNSKTEIGCLCVLSHLLCFFLRGTTHLCYHLPFSAAVLCYNQANFTCLMIKGALCSFFCRRRNTNS